LEQDRHRGHGSVVKITSKLSVDRLDVETSLPSTWAVPRDRSATLVNLTGHEIPSKRNGEEYTIDGFIRAEVRIHSKCSSSSSIARKILIPTTNIRTKTHGEAPQAIPRAMSMYTALVRTTPSLSVAVAFN
jgi:hypothetical protein